MALKKSGGGGSGGGGGGDSFTTIQPDLGTAPVASSATDTLTLTSSDLSITGNSLTDTITYAVKNATVIGKVLTGFSAAAGTVSSADTILQGFNKVVANIALKQDALTIGNLTDAGTDGITVTGGTGAVIGSGTSIAQHVADASHNGYLSSTDWSTFNGKGTGTVSGPGSSTDKAIARWNGTGGTTLQDTSTTTIDNSGNMFFGSTSRFYFENPGTGSPGYGIARASSNIGFFVNNGSFTPSFEVESGGVVDINRSAQNGTLNIGGNNFGGTALIQAGLGVTSADGTILNINAGNFLGTTQAQNGGALTMHAGDTPSTSASSNPGKILIRGGNQNAASGGTNGGDAELRAGNCANANNGGNVLLTPGTSSTGLPGAIIHASRISFTGIQRETASTTVTIADNTSVFIADYGSLQGSATITLPASTHLTNGQMISFGSGANGITALTLSAGSGTSITGALTTLVVGTSATYIYVTASTTWYRVS